MLAGKGNIWSSGYVFKLENADRKESGLFNFTGDWSAENRVQGFRVTASPMARKLAGLLASSPVITLPIVRLIQETFLKDSIQVKVAEVFLGGLLKPLSEIKPETDPDQVQYDFMEGVRELLLDSVPSDYVLNVIDKVSKYVAKKLDLSVKFAAVLKKEQPVKDSKTADQIGYFATVTAQVLRRLGGEYAQFADELENDNQVDLSTDNAQFAEELESDNQVDLSTDIEATPQDEETQHKITELLEIIKTHRNGYIRMRAFESLEKINPGNPQVIAGLVKLIEATKNGNILRIARDILRKIDPGNSHL